MYLKPADSELMSTQITGKEMLDTDTNHSYYGLGLATHLVNQNLAEKENSEEHHPTTVVFNLLKFS
jgi:hypothetical protein